MDPRSLPVYRHERELLDAITHHQVVVVEGPTGSGKTTQLPQILLDAGLTDRLIGVTQPRRIAAVSVAARIAEERGVVVGGEGSEVGYAIRFDERTSADTRVKIMTDGILLQEARTDADFSRYGVIIVDEAHERSLNIDFLLGLLHRAIPQGDLRVVVSSATIQPARFQEFFGPVTGYDVPLVSIDARPHPVKIRYRPPASDHPREAPVAAAAEIARIQRSRAPGHVLVFMPGEAAIRDTIDRVHAAHLPGAYEALPLYGRLTREEQERVFLPTPGRRKIIVSTNIAETSITVDDVRWVVDSGLAKIPRVSPRTGVVSLVEEGISQASADQRAGRAGRTAPGEAIRLYTAGSYKARPRFTDEEILRLDLADVVLRLIDLGIHDVERFPFPTPPALGKLRAAVETLRGLDAIDDQRHLTAIGERMVPFPLTPRLARMVVEAADRYPDVLDDVLVVAAFLSGRHPWSFPPGSEEDARAAHRALAHPLGDAMTSLNAYRGFRKARDPQRYCARHFLDLHALRFIQSAHEQLADMASHLGMKPRAGGAPEHVVRALARAYDSQILRLERRTYESPTGAEVALHPGSALFGSRHRFVVAMELVYSTRLYGRNVSALSAKWLPDVAPDLARRWHVRGESRRTQHLEQLAALPDTVHVGGVDLPVTVRRGKPTVDVPLAAVAALGEAGLAAVPEAARRYSASVVDDPTPRDGAGAQPSGKRGAQRYAQGTPLGELVALLPLLPLPEPGAHLSRENLEGALLEVDRNLHALLRALDAILEVKLPAQGRRPGWVALVANGGGGYWLEVMTSYPLALQSSVEALADLEATIPPSDRGAPRVSELREALDARWDEVQVAVASAKPARRRRRRRR